MFVNRKSWYSVKLSLDLLLLNITFLVSAVLAQSWDILIHRRYMFFLLFALNVFWYFSTRITDLYENLSLHGFANRLFVIVKNVVVQSVITIFFIFAIKENLFTRNFTIFYFTILNLLINSRSILLKYFQNKFRFSEKYLRNLLIIGNNKTGMKFYDFVQLNRELGYRFIGFVDDSVENSDARILGSLDDLDTLLQQNNIDEVVVSIPNSAADKMNKIIAVCNKNAVRVHIIPDYFQFLSKKFLVSVIGNFPIITVRDEPLGEIQWRIVKRFFDIVFSSLAIIFILSWLVPILALLIKLSSKGPVFFIQDRIGLRNKKFSCLKFRTMYFANNNTGEKFVPTIKGDQRITKIGKFLRSSNLDEVPQFWNVLIGDMSIVGPRPHAIAYHEEYLTYFEAIKLRHSVKPGLTGWAQVHGLRGDVTDEEENKNRTIKRIEYDLWYIENWNFSLDIQIIFLTVWQMISRNTKGF